MSISSYLKQQFNDIALDSSDTHEEACLCF